MNRITWKSLLLATMTVMLCVLIISGSTFALFTDSVTYTNHLQAGKLKVGLKRTKLEWVTIDSDGYLKKNTDSTELDLSTVSSANVFGLTDESKIAPLAYYEATLVIENRGNVAFDYTIGFIRNETTNNLTKQLKVTVKDGSKNVLVTKMMDEFSSTATTFSVKPSATSSTQTLDNSDTASEVFVVRVEFVDDGRPVGVSTTTPVNTSFVNNDAMDLAVNFDLVVTAVQNTTIKE